MEDVKATGEMSGIYDFKKNGANRTRTGGFHNAIVTLYQLSYSP